MVLVTNITRSKKIQPSFWDGRLHGLLKWTYLLISREFSGANIINLDVSRKTYELDQLTYHYLGNRLHRVDDASGSTEGFANGSNQANEMAYDNNGNLTRDLNRGYADNGLLYNALNLLRYINKGGQELRYTYDGTGAKHRLQAPAGITYYAGAFEYKGDGTLLRIGLPEGQLIRNTNGTYSLNYYLKDHLGNVRVVFDESGTVIQMKPTTTPLATK
ncbi:hypothetical protein [Arundinibacter roseus]|uniref:RHS repeat protein n=1 Tax=Arundinibacter roseus TaxID=2070510 RepID=A0A4R4KMS7_9BACT|nr:hypothetical protein [Arundinibacter roseus]TDB67989.1 hypothetical protein EZE20_03425 [Arundinibacter roseus]